MGKHEDILLREFNELITLTQEKCEHARIIVSGMIEHRSDREKNRMIGELYEQIQAIFRERTNTTYCDKR